MKKIILLFIFIFISIISSSPAFAENFYIENYDVKMNVNEDKSVDVIENIDVVFTAPSHGIYRTIPLKDDKITNIKVSEQNEIKIDGTIVNIKIGSPSRLVEGKHKYKISYTYHFLDKKNEFYYNIIGTDWDTMIYKVLFDITMPKIINENQIGLSIGKLGTSGFKDGAKFFVFGNKIIGTVNKPLQYREGVTIRVQVDENYFTESNMRKYYNSLHQICIYIIIILTIISVLIWYFLGKDNHVTPVVSFYPPENVDSVEAEIISRGKCTFQGLVALLIQLAGKGYIKIKENSKENTFRLYKVKNEQNEQNEQNQQKPKLNYFEKEYLNFIFDGEETVSKYDLERSRSFYKNCQKLIKKINKKIPKHYETSPQRELFKILLFASFAVTFILMFCGLLNFTMPTGSQTQILFIYAIVISSLIPMIFKQKSISIIVMVIFISIHFYIILLGFEFRLHINTLFLMGLVCSIISALCIYFFPKRNLLGTKLEGQLRGLKHFIEVANKERLETLVCENPEYFYNILPYAYILGVSNKWIKNFETIVMPRAESQMSLYTNVNAFTLFTNSFYMCTLPSKQNGGIKFSNGRGGFVGGGGGGGGGRSW